MVAAMADAPPSPIKERIKETAMAEAKDRLWYVRPLLSFAVYLCAGIFFYTNIETKPCAGPAMPFYMLALDEITGDSGSGPDVPPPVAASLHQSLHPECQSNCTVPWTPLDAIYFGVVTMSTVGYGDLSPATWYSQLFTVFYIFIGILAVFSQLTATVMDLFGPAFDFSRKVLSFVLPAEAVDVDEGDGKDHLLLHRKNSALYYARRMLGPVLMLFAFQLIFAFAFTAIEPDWGFGLAIYHCLVTATTVGYGDVPIVTNRGKICAIVHILVSVCALGAIVGDIDEARTERAAQIVRARQLTQKFDRSRLENLLTDKRFNQDGGGVEKFEFVVGMLLEAAYVQQSDVDAYVTLFERADVTGDGKISSADIDNLTAAFDNMWPSHMKLHHALSRSGTGKPTAQKYNKVAPVAPSSSEARTRWGRARAGAKVGDISAADPLTPARPRPKALAEHVDISALGHAPALGRARPDQAGRSRARPGAAILMAPPDQARRRGAPSSSKTRWSRTGAKVSSGQFSAALEPVMSQRSFVEQGGARSRVTP